MKTSRLFLSAAVALLALSACSKKEQTETAPAEETADAPLSAKGMYDSVTDHLGLTAGKPVVIDFNATWCGPCKQFAPVFEAAKEADGQRIDFVEVDVDDDSDFAASLGVSGIPHVLLVMPDGTSYTHVGLMTADEFAEFLAPAL